MTKCKSTTEYTLTKSDQKLIPRKENKSFANVFLADKRSRKSSIVAAAGKNHQLIDICQPINPQRDLFLG